MQLKPNKHFVMEKRFRQEALALSLVPDNPNFILSASSVYT